MKILRFRGPKANHNHGLPPADKRPPTACISRSWAAKGSNDDFPALEDDPAMTILSLEIPDGDFDQDDLAWIIDDGAEADDEGGES